MARRTIETVTLGNLEEAGLKDAYAIFKVEMRRAITDAVERGCDEIDRKVQLEFVVTPVVGQRGEVEKITMCVRGKAMLPPQRSGSAMLDARANGDLVFNAESPDDPGQGTIDEEIERNQGRERGGKDGGS